MQLNNRAEGRAESTVLRDSFGAAAIRIYTFQHVCISMIHGLHDLASKSCFVTKGLVRKLIVEVGLADGTSTPW
jgi:hypothetical protein